MLSSERYNMLEIKGLGTPKLRNRKTQSKKDLNNPYNKYNRKYSYYD